MLVRDNKMSIQLDKDYIRRLQMKEPKYNSVIDYMHNPKIKTHLGFTIDSQGILCETVKNHDKKFDAVVVP